MAQVLRFSARGARDGEHTPRWHPLYCSGVVEILLAARSRRDVRRMLSTHRRTPQGNTPREGGAQYVDALLALSCLVVSCLLGYALLYWIVEGSATEFDMAAACVAAVGSGMFGFFGVRHFCRVR